jgi:hypothetical protein
MSTAVSNRSAGRFGGNVIPHVESKPEASAAGGCNSCAGRGFGISSRTYFTVPDVHARYDFSLTRGPI